MISFPLDGALHIPMWSIRALKSGEVSLFTDGMKALQLKVENKKIDINLMNKELLMDILKEGLGKSLLSRLLKLKNIAEELRRDGLTVTLSHEGCVVLTMGSGAKSTLLKLITGSNAIEVSNLGRLLRLVT